MSINQRIFDLLELHIDGQAKLSRFLGINQSTITTWKNRQTDPPAKYLVRISEFLNVSLMFILTGVEDMPQQKQAINDDENRALEYYRRLNTENKDYVKGEMVRLHKEQEKDLKGNNEGHTRGLAK